VADFARAVESGDIESIVALLTDDASVTMPPQSFEYRGHTAIATFLRDRADLRGHPLRLAATRANGQPAFGCYLPAGVPPIARAYALWVLTLTGDRISDITWFFDTSYFPRFGLPRTLPGR
jgi:hypothetical protein